MIIIGVDFHPEFQQIALLNTTTGEVEEKRLAHPDEAEKFYRALASANETVRMGMEASGHARWFERLMAELQFELWIGDAAEIRTGSYNALLLNCVPRLVLPSKKGDYFFEEQVALWGIDGFWGLPHYTKTEYYRTDLVKMSNRRGLFEFVVPMFPKNYLHTNAISSYRNALSEGVVPTALAISILDVKQPANWDGDPDITEHWCLSHYLLDGHHKVYAACELGKPVSILSFLAPEKGISTREQVAEAIQTLATR